MMLRAPVFLLSLALLGCPKNAPADNASSAPEAAAPESAPEAEEGAAQAAEAPAEELPDATSLMEAAALTLGDPEILRTMTSRYARGRLVMAAQGMEASMEMWSAPPNLQLVQMEIPGLGVFWEGFDGTHAWGDDPMQGPRLKAGLQAQQAAYSANFLGDLNWQERYSDSRTVASVEFHGRPAWKVETMVEETFPMTLYFDQEEAWPIGMEMRAATPMGPMTVESWVPRQAYVDGILLPEVVIQTVAAMGMTMEMHFEEWAFNLEELPSFDLPERVQELLEQ